MTPVNGTLFLDPETTATAPVTRPADAEGRAGPGERGVELTRSPRLGERELRHEVGNALTVAMGFAQQLLRRAPVWAEERERRALLGIVESVAHAWQLCDRDLGGGRTARPTDLADLLLASSSLLPPERADDLRIRWDTAGPVVGSWDPAAIREVLVNLLGNAAKYSPADSPIEVEVATPGRGDWVRVIVADHGIGIADDALERVFDGQRTAEARSAASGSGIGLRLVRRLVEAEGGAVWAMPRPGGGCAIFLALPLPEGPADVAHCGAWPVESTGRTSRSVLVVEDDEWARRYVTQALEDAGHDVACASNGFSGLRLLERQPREVLVLDLQLPERSGVDLLRAVRASRDGNSTRIVVVSGALDALGADDRLLADACLAKPFALDELLCAVASGPEPGERPRPHGGELGPLGVPA